MTIAANRSVAPFGAISTFRLVTAVENVALAIGRAWRAGQTRRALERRSAHELADIGLADTAGARADLAAIARTLAARRG